MMNCAVLDGNGGEASDPGFEIGLRVCNLVALAQIKLQLVAIRSSWIDYGRRSVLRRSH